MSIEQTEANKAYHILLNQIISGQLRPGTHISRRRMAEIVGTSVIPVTEALKRLESDGLIVTHARAGSMIAFPSREEMEGKYILRDTIESKIGEILCENGINRRQESTLRETALALDSEKDASRRPYLHKDFHLMLAQYTGYQCFVDIYNSTSLYFIICNAIFSRRRTSSVPPDFHLKIVNAIVSGDVAQARGVMHDHVYDSYDYVMHDLDKMREEAANPQA